MRSEKERTTTTSTLFPRVRLHPLLLRPLLLQHRPLLLLPSRLLVPLLNNWLGPPSPLACKLKIQPQWTQNRDRLRFLSPQQPRALRMQPRHLLLSLQSKCQSCLLHSQHLCTSCSRIQPSAPSPTFRPEDKLHPGVQSQRNPEPFLKRSKSCLPSELLLAITTERRWLLRLRKLRRRKLNAALLRLQRLLLPLQHLPLRPPRVFLH